MKAIGYGVGYTRVSSQEQTEGTSLDFQEQQIKGYAGIRGLDLVDTFSDGGVSGGIPFAERPGARRLLRAIKKGAVKHVIITKLDRGFRSASDCLNTIEGWDREGIALHIVDMQGASIDTSSPTGKFMLTILAAVAEMERGMIRDRCNNGRAMRKAQGRAIGHPPFGYVLGEDGHTLKVHPEEHSALVRIRQMRADGASMREIARTLNAEGIKTKHGKVWAPGHVESVLRRYRKEDDDEA